MKNRLFLFVLVFGVTALFSSCLNIASALLTRSETYEIVLDEYSPTDRNVTLTFAGSFILKRWNGSDMQNTMYGKRRISNIDKVILTIPAGDNSFIFDVYVVLDSSTSYASYRTPNVELQYLLEAGKKYQIKTRHKSLGFSKGYEFFAEIYDVTNRSAVLLKEWKLGES
jgi:hypothetical protein